ncbi:hypothetical protein K1W54_34765 [Micromonospora sp. CPCC 205371]|nr:hypothetical protein [Micromonospora sp. CPCC 205371]
MNVVRARARWLLRSLREHAADPTLRSLRGFGAAYPGGISYTTVSKWETGAIPFGDEQVHAYEELLSVGARRIATVVDSAARLTGDAIGLRPSTLDEASRQERVLSLVEHADSTAPMTSHQWDDLTGLLSGWRYPGLRKRDWELLTIRLGTELYASSGPAWLRRHEALCRLLNHPSGRAIAAATCVRMVRDKTSPVCGDVLLALDATDDPSAAGTVLGQLREPTGADAQRRAAIVCLSKLHSGHFDGGGLYPLAMSAIDLFDVPELQGAVGPIAAELAHRNSKQLPRAVASKLMNAADTLIANENGHDELREVRLPRGLPTDDPMLRTLVDEMLRHADASYRFLAGQWLAASPYGDQVAERIADALRRCDVLRHPISAPVHLEALTILGGAKQRSIVRALVVSPEVPTWVRFRAVRALSHMAGPGSEPVRDLVAHQRAAWQRGPTTTATEAVLNQLAYTAGATGDTALLDVLAGDGMPETVRVGARWWRGHPHLVRNP